MLSPLNPLARSFALLLVGVPLVATAGCGGPVACTDQYVYGLTVIVEDGAGAPICDATVTVRDGDYEETLESLGGEDCSYIGAGERAGTYVITASKPGYEDAVETDVVVDEDECHVLPVTRTLVLTPLAAPG